MSTTHQGMSPSLRRLALAVEWSALGLAALVLLALGMSWLQTPQLLSMAIFCFTLAMCAWNRVHVRLVNSISSGFEQHFAPWMLLPSLSVRSQDIRQHRDAAARRCITRWETVMFVTVLPLAGWLSDTWGIYSVFILSGSLLISALGLALIARSGLELNAVAPLEESHLFPEQSEMRRVQQAQGEQTNQFWYQSGGEQESSARETTAHHPILLPQSMGEKVSERDDRVEGFALLPLGEEEGNSQPNANNGSARQ